MSHKPLEIIEGNDPSIEFTCYDVSSAGVRTTTNLTGATIECYVKDNPATADNAVTGVTKYSTTAGSITIVNPTGGKCRVDFGAAAFVGNVSYYHLDVIRSGRRLTYAYGPVKKVNV
jgi:hypothetical protein